MKKSNSKMVPLLALVLFLLVLGFLLTRCVSLHDKERAPVRPEKETPVDSSTEVVSIEKMANPKTNAWSLWNNGAQLRGVNVWQKRIEPQYDGDGMGTGRVGPPYSDADLERLSSLGANWINLSYPGPFTEVQPYLLDEAVIVDLDEWMKRCLKYKLFVTLSFRTGPGRNEANFDESEKKRAIHSVWTDPKAQEAWVAMWRYVAHRYGKHPALAGFHLMVEPESNRWVQPKVESPEDFYPKYKGQMVDWNSLAAKLIQGIRQENAEVPILVGAMNYSHLQWTSVLELPRVNHLITNVHFYEPYPYSHKEVVVAYPGFVALEQTDGEIWNKHWLEKQLSQVQKLKSTGPVSVGEFGVIRHQMGGPRYLEEVTGIFEELGVNYAVWLWESSYKGITYDSFNFRRGTQESNHKEITDQNLLIEVLKKRWSKNIQRPG